MIEENNKLLPEMIMIGTKWENMSILIVEYLHPKIKNSLFHWEMIIIQERKIQLILMRLP